MIIEYSGSYVPHPLTHTHKLMQKHIHPIAQTYVHAYPDAFINVRCLQAKAD